MENPARYLAEIARLRAALELVIEMNDWGGRRVAEEALAEGPQITREGEPIVTTTAGDPSWYAALFERIDSVKVNDDLADLRTRVEALEAKLAVQIVPDLSEAVAGAFGADEPRGAERRYRRALEFIVGERDFLTSHDMVDAARRALGR